VLCSAWQIEGSTQFFLFIGLTNPVTLSMKIVLLFDVLITAGIQVRFVTLKTLHLEE
jgi:hypothetical protein